jgi:iron complex transport system ATP-binding protein
MGKMNNKSAETELSSNPPVIHMQGVSWIDGNKHIVRNINWDVHHGEHWAIIGLNGSGKTTLLNMVNGYIWPSEGEMSVLGKHFGSYDIRDLRKKIGWVSSSLQEKFYTNETAEEIVLSGKFATIGLYDSPKSKDVEHAMMLLSRLKCEHTALQPYWTLSQGEKQKVLIARALISSPHLLILDEPCAGLDIFSREHLLSLIEHIGRQESAPTLLYVSHRIEEILPVFTHTLLLRRGMVHSQGKTREVLTTRNLSAFYQTPVDIQWDKDRAWIWI